MHISSSFSCNLPCFQANVICEWILFAPYPLFPVRRTSQFCAVLKLFPCIQVGAEHELCAGDALQLAPGAEAHGVHGTPQGAIQQQGRNFVCQQVTVNKSSMSIDMDKFNKQVVGNLPTRRCFPLRILSYVLEFWRPLFDAVDMPKPLSVCVWAPGKLLRVKSNRIRPSGQGKHGRGFGGPRSRDASNDSRRSGGGGASSRHSSRGSSAARPVEAPSPSPHPPEIREGLGRWCEVA